MNHSCTFQHPQTGWWIHSSYDLETNYLHLQPLLSVPQYVEEYNESNRHNISVEEIQQAILEWEDTKEWCKNHSQHFETSKEADSYVKEISHNEDVYIGA